MEKQLSVIVIKEKAELEKPNNQKLRSKSRSAREGVLDPRTSRAAR